MLRSLVGSEMCIRDSLNFVHTAYFVMNNILLSKINQGSPGGRRNERLATSTLLGTWRNPSFLFHHHLEKFPFPSIQNNLRKIVIFNLLATGKTPFTYHSILSLFQFNYGFMFARYQEQIVFLSIFAPTCTLSSLKKYVGK